MPALDGGSERPGIGFSPIDVEYHMNMIAHDRVSADVEREYFGELDDLYEDIHLKNKLLGFFSTGS